MSDRVPTTAARPQPNRIPNAQLRAIRSSLPEDRLAKELTHVLAEMRRLERIAEFARDTDREGELCRLRLKTLNSAIDLVIGSSVVNDGHWNTLKQIRERSGIDAIAPATLALPPHDNETPVE